MLNRVEARKPSGSLLNLTLDDISSGLIVEKIEGLDPVKATLVSSKFGQLDGERHQNSQREPRYLKLTIGLRPDYATETVSGLRRRIYDFFMPKTSVKMRFYDSDYPYLDIEGVVETCTTALFAKEPAAEVAITCFNPDLVNPNSTVFPSLTTATTNEVTHIYAGTVVTGGRFSFMAPRAISNFSIYHRGPDGVLTPMHFTDSFEVGDIVEICTVPGEKKITRSRGGVVSSILYALSPQSKWIMLQPGGNFFRFYVEGNPFSYALEYHERYGGL